jgi:hypothetical protein
VRDNVVVDRKGPDIMMYGAHGSDRPVLIKCNVVKGSIRSSGIVLGGGPAVVRNNVLVGNSRGGISLEDYGRRGLLRGIVVVHNTLWQNEQAGIIAPAVMPGEVSIVNNAVQAAPGVPAWPAGDRSIRLAGNVDCAVAPCFTSGEGQDFSPIPTGMLAAAGAVRVDLWMPRDDFFGALRTIPPAVGAVERRSGPLRLAPRP